MKMNYHHELFKYIILVILTGEFFLANSQTSSYYLHHSSDTLTSAYNLPISEIRENIYAEIPLNLKQDYHAKLSYCFAGLVADFVSGFVNSGNIYHDWPALEIYINKIFKEILPPENKNDSLFHVYIVKDGYFNAFNSGSKQFFVNIGIFNDVNDEASIAAILAHEFSHYYYRHSLLHYFAQRRGDFTLGLLGESDKLENTFSIKEEQQADIMSIRLLANSKYNAKAVLNVFEIMGRLENNEIAKSSERFELKETDHPKAGARYDDLLSFYNRYKNDSALYFIISEESFHAFKKEASFEILDCQMKNLKYDDCIEQAFRLHLHNPDEKAYIYYMLESIRRICTLSPGLWDQQFITDRYYDTLWVNGEYKKKKMTDHIFTKFNFNVLPLSSAEADTLLGRFYWTGEVKFKTNEQAFEFYCRLSEALGDHEFLLSNALSFSSDTAKMNKFLLKYLEFPIVKHRAYAEEVLKGSLKTFEGEKKLLVMNNFKVDVRLGTEDLPVNSFGHDTSNAMISIVDSLVKRENAAFETAIYMPSLKRYHMNYYLQLFDLQRFTTKFFAIGGKRNDIFLLDPLYWETMRKFNTNEVEFINCSYFEEKGGEKSLEKYKAIMDDNFGNMFSQSKVTRFLSLCIASIRITDKGIPVIVYCSKEEKLDFKSNGYNAITLKLKEQLTLNEKCKKNVDYNYNKK